MMVPRERGAALLTVLLLVAVMAVVSAGAIERLTLATRLSASAAAMEQARHFALAGEALALRRIDQLVSDGGSQVTLRGDWHGQPFTLPLPVPGGSADMTVTDGGNCFNLNSLAGRDGAARPLAIGQFVALMAALGVPEMQAQRVAAGAADWIDADQAPLPGGAEDSAYAGRRTSDGPMADARELAGVAGVDAPLLGRVAGWVCALPTDDLSPLNVNTLLPEQAPLLRMLAPAELSPARAGAYLAARPADGYGGVQRFWSGLGVRPPGEAASQVGVATRWFRLETRVRMGGVALAGQALIDAERGRPARVVRRSWGPAE